MVRMSPDTGLAGSALFGAAVAAAPDRRTLQPERPVEETRAALPLTVHGFPGTTASPADP